MKNTEEELLVLDISKAIDAASGFAQGIETQDLEPKKKKKVKDDGDDSDDTGEESD